MNAQEFGTQNSTKIVLIPGNMMCWKQFEQVIPLLEKDYHVTAISTDGYDGTGGQGVNLVRRKRAEYEKSPPKAQKSLSECTGPSV